MHALKTLETKKANALLIGDSPADVTYIIELLAELADFQFNIQQTTTAFEFETALAEEQWDLILCDFALTTLSPANVLMLAKNSQPLTPVILFSDNTTVQDAVDMMRLGARGFVDKTDRPRITEIVRQELETDRYQDSGRIIIEQERLLRQLKHELLLNRNPFSGILDKMQDALMSLSLPDRKLIYVSDSYEKVFGYPLHNFLDDPAFFKQVVHPDDLKCTIDAMQRCVSEGSIELEHRIILPDGRVRWVHRHAWINYDEAGHPIRINDSGSDITERKNTELALHESEQILRLFVEHAPAAIAMFDRNMKYLSVSRRWLTDYRLSREDIIGHSHYEIFPDIPKRWKKIHRRALKGAVQKNDADPFPRADGTLDWVRWEIHPWRDFQGKIGGIILFSEVITDRKQAEEALRRSESRLIGLRKLDRAIVAALSLKQLGELALNQLVQLIPCFQATISRVNEESKTLYILAAYSEATTQIPVEKTFPMDNIYLTALEKNPYFIIENLDQTTNTSLHQLHKESVRSILLVRLKMEGHIIGLLALHALNTGYFTEEIIQIALEIADQLAIGVHKTALSETLAQQVVALEKSEESLKLFALRMEVLHMIDLGLINGNSIEELVGIALKEIRRIIPCLRASVVIIDQLTGEMVVFAADYEGETVLGPGSRAPVTPDTYEGFDANNLRLIDDLRPLLEKNPHARQLYNEGIVSGLNILLKNDGQPIGSLGLFASKPGFFTPEYQQIALEIGNQLAIAIRQMQLSDALARHSVELEQRVIERTAELQASKDRLEAILYNSRDGILLVDRDLSIQKTNPAFEKLVDFSDNKQPMKNLLEFVGKEDADRVKSTVARAVMEQNSSQIEVRANRRDGTTVDIELGVGYIPDDGLVSTIHDISERKRTEAALQEALAQEKELGELKSRFVSMASHEFRTPLASILATTEAMFYYRDRMDQSQIEARLEKIRQQVMHMKDIMEDVLQLARINAGRVEFNPAQGDLDAICREIVEEFDNQSPYRGRINYSCANAPVILDFDIHLMRQVISNLISNALKYSPSDKNIRIELTQDSNHVVLKVTDAGIGIPPKDLKHLFEPFHRATNVGNISGTGLGLSIAKQSVELHGGTILPESQLGIGTTLTVILPATKIERTDHNL